jgi:hypothetical protein
MILKHKYYHDNGIGALATHVCRFNVNNPPYMHICDEQRTLIIDETSQSQ